MYNSVRISRLWRKHWVLKLYLLQTSVPNNKNQMLEVLQVVNISKIFRDTLTLPISSCCQILAVIMLIQKATFGVQPHSNVESKATPSSLPILCWLCCQSILSTSTDPISSHPLASGMSTKDPHKLYTFLKTTKEVSDCASSPVDIWTITIIKIIGEETLSEE